MERWFAYVEAQGFKKYSVLFYVLWLSVNAQQSFAINDIEDQKPKTTQAVLRLNSLAKAFERVNLDSTTHYYELAIKEAKKNNDLGFVATTMNRLGFVNIFLIKDEAKAVEWLNKAITVATRTDDFLNLAESHKLLANVMDRQNIGDPIELIDKAAAYAKKANSWRIELDCFEIKAGFLINLQAYDEAEKTYIKLRKISRKHSLDDWLTTSLDYAKLLEYQNRHAEATTIYKELDAEKNKLKQAKGYFVYMNDTGQLATKLKKYAEAERILYDILAYEKAQVQVDTLHLIYIYDSLVELYKATGNYQQALENFQKWSEAKLWLNNKRLTQDSQIKLTKLKANLDLEKKEIAINLLKTQKEEQLLLLIGAIALATILAASVFYVQKNKREIERQRLELSKLNATKDKLFTILSHDLRSPVANLENNITLSNWGALDQSEFAESVKGLGVEVQRVRNMLENMLFWATSQMDGIKPAPSHSEVRVVVQDQMDFLKNKADAKGIRFINDIPAKLSIYADQDHLSIIFRNLLQNALKFFHQNGEITVSFQHKDTLKQIDISDNGIGMPDELTQNLFQIGKQTSRAGTNLETGTGVGLMLVKELIELNKLELTVVSKVKIGTTFSILF